MVASGDKGFIVQADDGLPVFFPFGGGAVNPCDPDPEMLLTVTGTSGTINWCGQTWVLPGESGVQKSVCPTEYAKGFTTVSTTYTGNNYTTWNGAHVWNNQSAPGLNLRRAYNVRYDGNAQTFNRTGYGYGLSGDHAFLVLGPASPSSFDQVRFWHLGDPARPVPPTTTQVTPYLQILATGTPYAFGLNVGPAYDLPTRTYDITDAFFSSKAIGGITYAWEKGQGWP